MFCPLCEFGDLEDGEVCAITNEPLYVFKKCWINEPPCMRGERTIVKLEVPAGSFIHYRRGRKPDQGRAPGVKCIEFLHPDGQTNEQAFVCGTDQKPRNDGRITYTPGEWTSMSIEHAKNPTRRPWFPGIHFHLSWEDITQRP